MTFPSYPFIFSIFILFNSIKWLNVIKKKTWDIQLHRTRVHRYVKTLIQGTCTCIFGDLCRWKSHKCINIATYVMQLLFFICTEIKFLLINHSRTSSLQLIHFFHMYYNMWSNQMLGKLPMMKKKNANKLLIQIWFIFVKKEQDFILSDY